jgi:hypothetical protein
LLARQERLRLRDRQRVDVAAQSCVFDPAGQRMSGRYRRRFAAFGGFDGRANGGVGRLRMRNGRAGEHRHGEYDAHLEPAADRVVLVVFWHRPTIAEGF